MYRTNKRGTVKKGLALLLMGIILPALIMAGCATSTAVKQEAGAKAAVSESAVAGGEDTGQAGMITGVSVNDTPEAVVVSVKSTDKLDYSVAEPPLEQSIVLYFPDAGLAADFTKTTAENTLVGDVTCSELISGGPTKVVIPMLKPGIPYNVQRGDDNSINVLFARTGVKQQTEQAAPPAVSGAEKKEEKATVAQEETAEESGSVVYATRLEKVEVTESGEDHVNIAVMADGVITGQKMLVLKSPPRVVFDIPGIQAATRSEQRIAIDSPVASRVRYFAHPDHLRVVVDLKDSKYLAEAGARPTSNGLLIYVGEPAAGAGTPQPEVPAVEASSAVASATPSATAPPETPAETSKAVAPAAPSATAAPETPAGTTEAAEPAAPVAEAEAEAAAPAPAAAEQESKEAAEKTVAAMPVRKKYEKPALVNKIDFIEGEDGKSILEIGTTHPVDYEVVKVADRKLYLKLNSANILSFRQRPLITTRFDSAVDLILPVQTRKMKDKGFSIVNIDLREDVPYTTGTDENGKLIRIEFAASSIPPNPAKKVVIPTEYAVEQLVPEEKAGAESGVAAAEQAAPAAEQAAPAAEEAAQPEGSAAAAAAEEGAAGGTVAPAGETAAQAPEAAVAQAPVETGTAQETAQAAPVAAAEQETEAKPGLLAMLNKKKKYTGEPIALDFYKTDIRNVIRILKDVSGKNFAIDQDVSGSVTLSFVNPVPWDQVLDLVLEMNDLGKVEENGIIRIATKATLTKQKEAEKEALAALQELQKTHETLTPLETRYFPINYANASKDVLPHIKELLSERGHAQVDSRTNQIIMTDVPENLEKAREIIERIDRVTPQVMIKARIVETSNTFAREFGTEWGMSNKSNAYGINIGTDGAYRSELGGTYTYDVALNSLTTPVQNIIGVNFARIVGTPFSLDAKLSLMETNGDVKIVSTPKVVTLDNKTATISQGLEYPYLKLDDSGNTTTEFKDIELKLDVTPHVTPDNRISMKINITKNDIGEVINGEQSFNTKEADTELLVNDGDTVVIGGIMKERQSKGYRGVPLLSRIPVIGALFRYTTKSNDKNELLIFITPQIVRLD